MPEYPLHSFGHWPGPALLTQASQGREAVQTTPQPTLRAGSPALRRSGNHLGEGPARAPSPQPPSTDPGLRCAQECGGPGIGRKLEASPQPASWCPGIALLLK